MASSKRYSIFSIASKVSGDSAEEDRTDVTSLTEVAIEDGGQQGTITPSSSSHQFPEIQLSTPNGIRRGSITHRIPLETEILEEAKRGNFQYVEELSRSEICLVNLNEQDSEGKTVLHYACLRRSYHTVKMLLETNFPPNVNIKDKTGRTPLHNIAKSWIGVPTTLNFGQNRGHDTAIVEMLMKNGANVNEMDIDGLTALHLVASMGKLGLTQQLLQNPEIDITITNKKKESALHLAAQAGFNLICDRLLKHFNNHVQKYKRVKTLDDITARDELFQTPIHKAAGYGNLNTVKRIVAEIVSRSGILKQREILNKTEDYNLKNPLFLAVEKGHRQVAEYLLRHTDKNHLEKNKASLLHYAAYLGNTKLLSLIYECSGEIDKRDINLRTPLHYAVNQNKIDAMKFLIEKRVGVDLADKDGQTPLLLATMNGHSDAVKILIEGNANISVVDNFGRNILHYCAIQGHLNVLQVLLDNYRDKIEDLVNKGNNLGNTALHEAANKGYVKIMQYLLDEAKARVNIENKEYNTPLCLAAHQGHPEIAYTLIRRRLGLDLLRHKNLNENTPLHIACLAGHDTVAQIFLSRGAAPEEINSIKQTPLMCAAMNGHYECCLLLISFNCDVNSLGLENTTALHLASQKGHVQVVELLLKNSASLTTRNYFGKNPLEVAIENGEERVAKAIIDSSSWCEALKNISMDENQQRTSPFRMLIRRFPKAAETVLDKCVTIDKNKQECELNFEFIEDTCLCYKDDENSNETRQSARRSPYSKNISVIEKNHPLMIMVKYGRLNLLGHRVSQALINHKWKVYGRSVYYVNFAIFLSLLFSLTVYVWSTVDENYIRYKLEEKSGLIIDVPITCEHVKEACRNTRKTITKTEGIRTLQNAVIVTSIFNLLKEIFQLYQARLSYFNAQNIMEVICPSFSILLAYDEPSRRDLPCTYRSNWQWQLGSIAIFFAWLDLILRIRKFPFFGIYVVMLTTILKSFCKFFIIFLLFLFTFTMSFHMVFRKLEAFDSIHKAIIQTAIMTIGDLNYEDIFVVPVSFTGYVVFVVFLILMPILTMNLLVGLAVDDIKGVLADAKLKRLAMKVTLIMEIEMIFPKWLRNYKVFQNKIYLTTTTAPLDEERESSTPKTVERYFKNNKFGKGN